MSDSYAVREAADLRVGERVAALGDIEARYGPVAGDVLGTAAFSLDGTYRYLLTRRPLNRWWRPAVFIMLNPSTASERADDATIRKCAGYAKRWGAGGLTVVNLFALRSTDPGALRDHPDPVGPANDRTIELATTGYPAYVVAAWGRPALARTAERAEAVQAALEARGVPLRCIGLTAAGHPRHPLYPPYTDRPMPFGRSS